MADANIWTRLAVVHMSDRGPKRQLFNAGAYAMFVSLVGGAATVWPFAARAQPPSKPRVGTVFADNSLGHRNRETFIATLRGLGWIDGQNVKIDVRWHDEEIEDLVRLKVDVLYLAKSCESDPAANWFQADTNNSDRGARS
jgi:hypothetical protein